MTSEFGKLKLLFLLLIITGTTIAQTNEVKCLPSEMKSRAPLSWEQVNFEYDDCRRITRYVFKSSSTYIPFFEVDFKYDSNGRLSNMELDPGSPRNIEIGSFRYSGDSVFYKNNIYIIDNRGNVMTEYSVEENGDLEFEAEHFYDTIGNYKTSLLHLYIDNSKYTRREIYLYTDEKGPFFSVNIPNWQLSFLYADLMMAVAKNRVESCSMEGIGEPPKFLDIKSWQKSQIKYEYTEVNEQGYPLRIKPLGLDEDENICCEIKYIEAQ